MDFNKPRFFNTATQKGENYELKVELNSEYRDCRKAAVKKVIANMTVGKDVSGLFADVVKNMQTEDLELKKLVYLYLINYAKSQPELVILAVNTFVKDSDDQNPLIRSLAIRTMGCLRVEKITAYIMDPLKKSLADDDPYVRKTAALCVAKLYDLNPAVAIDNGLVTSLQGMLADRNPMVIANAVAALTEISEASQSRDLFQVNHITLTKLLAALNECTEWGQICILNTLSSYRPTSTAEATDIVEKVIPRLQHINGSVVLSAVKVLMVYLDYISDPEILQLMNKKLSPSLVTLLSAEPEIQYVVLRNINLILQKQPLLLNQEMRVFFTKYNDPPYIKLEKLEVIIKLCNEANIDQVLSELKEYATEVDVSFVRKAVRAIGRCAIKIEPAADKCIQVLLDLIKTQVSHVVQEAIIVTRDIFRKYPRQYEGILPALCENLESLDGSESKAALIWIIGEYAERIDNAAELLDYFLETFKEESSQVQLQLITSTVKLFLVRPASAQEMVQRVLNMATQGNENPDIRDRAYIYWRLLSSSPQAAKTVAWAEKDPIQLDNNAVNETLLGELISNISNLASVYYKPVSQVGHATARSAILGDEYEEPDLDGPPTQTIVQEVAKALGSSVGDLLDLDFAAPAGPVASLSNSTPVKASPLMDDLLGSVGMDLSPAMNVMGSFTPTGNGSFPGLRPTGFAFPKKTFLAAQDCAGLQVDGTVWKRDGQITMDMTFTNKSAGPMTDFAIQFNVNAFGIVPASPLQVPLLMPSGSAEVQLPLSTTGAKQDMDPANALQIAIKNNNGVYYFQTLAPIHAVLVEDRSGVSSTAFEDVWSAGDSSSFSASVKGDDFIQKLGQIGVHYVEQVSSTKWRLIAQVVNGGAAFAVELEKTSPTVLQVQIKSTASVFLPSFQESFSGIVSG